jgi:hypothetical protein
MPVVVTMSMCVVMNVTVRVRVAARRRVPMRAITVVVNLVLVMHMPMIRHGDRHLEHGSQAYRPPIPERVSSGDGSRAASGPAKDVRAHPRSSRR